MEFWVAFAIVIGGAFLFDLRVMGHGAISLRASLWMSALYIGLALLFGGAIGIVRGAEPALSYFAAYVLEKSLSLDNIFVFLLLFQHFRVPQAYQHRVLLWGILGALFLRGVLIFAGVALLHSAQWVIHLFGVLVLIGGVRLMTRGQVQPNPEHNLFLRLLRRTLPMTADYRGDAFVVREAGRWFATPLLAVIVVVETTDLIFAVDSIPAIFGLTQDPFIIYTSNVFAILGLRALYFALAGIVNRFHYLEYGLAVVLIMIGLKMVLESVVEIPPLLTVAITLTVLLGSAFLSLRHCRRHQEDARCKSDR